ncbi:hypothetical protein Clacol_008751 [Clathrus columnatus]|uniref:Uncharacterized protein n=1 Tax=Clathrus columnatus TaxID=1419009 RepID=A0AAV5ALD5_9AGAM|nr:hypothetical protein Clacol_008751 [Clathrus columnatus]
MLATVPCRMNRQAGDPRDRIRTARFNLPAPGFMTFTDPFPPIDNAMGLAKYISQMMLETAEAVLNLAFPAFEMNPDGTRPTFTRAQKVWARHLDGLEFFVPELSLILSLILVYLSGLSTGVPPHSKFTAGGPQKSVFCP